MLQIPQFVGIKKLYKNMLPVVHKVNIHKNSTMYRQITPKEICLNT